MRHLPMLVSNRGRATVRAVLRAMVLLTLMGAGAPNLRRWDGEPSEVAPGRLTVSVRWTDRLPSAQALADESRIATALMEPESPVGSVDLILLPFGASEAPVPIVEATVEMTEALPSDEMLVDGAVAAE